MTDAEARIGTATLCRLLEGWARWDAPVSASRPGPATGPGGPPDRSSGPYAAARDTAGRHPAARDTADGHPADPYPAGRRRTRTTGPYAYGAGGKPPGRPLSELLADALAELVGSGALPDGTVLPSQRALASALGVARGTVTRAYEHLAARDHLESRTGSGSRVRRRGRADSPAAPLDGRLASFSGHDTPFPEGGDAPLLDLSSGALPGLPMVREVVTGLGGRSDLARALGEEVATDGYHPAGLPALRAAVAAHYRRRGLPTEPGQILITSGSQQAVWLIAHTFLGPGDEAVVEDPSYRGALEAFRAVGARLHSVPVRADGPDLTHLASFLRRRRPRLLYCQPTAHNPTGASMTSPARRELATLLAEHEVFTVEDTCSADLILDDRGPRALLAAETPPDHPVLSVGTASKLLWGGLRVGWIRGAAPVVARLTEARKSVDLATAVVEQLVVAELLGRAEEARARRTEQLRARLETTETLLAARRPDWRWATPTGGTGLWIDIRDDAVALTERARRRGVRLAAGPAFSVFGGCRRYLRLPLRHPPEVLGTALDRLAAP